MPPAPTFNLQRTAPQPAQPPHLYPTLPQNLMQIPARCQRSDSPNLDTQAQQPAPLPLQPQFQPLPPPAQNTGVYTGQSQEPGRRDGDDWLNNVPFSSNERGRGGNCEESGNRGHGTRRGSMSRNRGEITDRNQRGSYMDSGGGAASIKAGIRNTIAISAEPLVVPVATQLQGAHHVNISGNPTLMNIGMNTGNLTTVNNYGGTHGLDNLKGFVSFAALHDSAEQDPDRRCHPGTRNTVLKRLRDWFDNPRATRRIVWLHGPAGAGKSAIAQTIANEYKERGLAATFFFYRSDAERNDGNRLFPTIAWQLAFSIPAIKDFIVHALDRTPHLPRKDVQTQFEQLVVHPFNDIRNPSRMPQTPVVIIDGVDECSNEQLQRRILALIGNAVKDCSVPLHFLICSRPEALIEETLNQFKDSILRIDLATLDDSHRDIEKYLVDQFSAIASKRGLDPTWPGQEIIQETVFESSGNFILPSTLIRFINDEDYSPESQLEIVRKLKPCGKVSPFALLDELYLEVLKWPPDQDFLKTFLALFVGRSFIKLDDLHKDDATLMNISEEELHIKLRKTRSLFKFKPFINVYHKSFLDFLQDPSRSGQYHVSKEGGLKRYLELIVDSVVRHVSMAVEEPNRHRTCRASPVFKYIVMDQQPLIVLPVEDWQEALEPLLDLQDKLLRTSRPQSCRVTQVMRELLLHLVLLQGTSYPIDAAQAPKSNMKDIITKWSRALVTKAWKSEHRKDLDGCLSVLLSRLQETNLVMVVDKAIIDCMSSLLTYDYTETAARVRTLSDAQKLIDLIDLLTNNESFLRQCGPDAVCKAARLASEIFARVPHIPQSFFLNEPEGHIGSPVSQLFEMQCQSAFIRRILDHKYIVPVLGIYDESDMFRLVCSDENEQNESVHEWLRRSSPNLVTRIRAILEVARTMRYIHSMDVALDSDFIKSKYFFLDSSFRAKLAFVGLFAWWVREVSIYDHESVHLADYTYESNVYAFGRLFRKVCFDRRREDRSNPLVKDAKQLMKRCRAKDPKSRPTMKDVVTAMETWDLT